MSMMPYASDHDGLHVLVWSGLPGHLDYSAVLTLADPLDPIFDSLLDFPGFLDDVHFKHS